MMDGVNRRCHVAVTERAIGRFHARGSQSPMTPLNRRQASAPSLRLGFACMSSTVTHTCCLRPEGQRNNPTPRLHSWRPEARRHLLLQPNPSPLVSSRGRDAVAHDYY